jgi:hypothetical protein
MLGRARRAIPPSRPGNQAFRHGPLIEPAGRSDANQDRRHPGRGLSISDEQISTRVRARKRAAGSRAGPVRSGIEPGRDDGLSSLSLLSRRLGPRQGISRARDDAAGYQTKRSTSRTLSTSRSTLASISPVYQEDCLDSAHLGSNLNEAPCAGHEDRGESPFNVLSALMKQEPSHAKRTEPGPKKKKERSHGKSQA